MDREHGARRSEDPKKAIRVLVAYGSRHGATGETADWIGDELHHERFVVDVLPASHVHFLDGYDAVVLGGALYSGRWQHDARQFVRRHHRALRALPVWLFSSGPLDESADRPEIGPVRGVDRIARHIGACGHVTFGGAIDADDGVHRAGDGRETDANRLRDQERVHASAREIAAQLLSPSARARVSGPTGEVADVAG